MSKKQKLESCASCGVRSASHPIAAIMNAVDVTKLEYATLEDAIATGEANGQAWAAMPICDKCHKEPNGTIKGHYQFRSNISSALAMAGSNTLGGPPKAKK